MNTSIGSSSYRPRNPGHDYYGRGVYLITLVVSGREHLLAHYESVHHNGHAVPVQPFREAIVMTPLGEHVMQLWQQTSAAQASHGHRVVTLAGVCMPDHFHGVIEVLEPMSWSLGDIIQAFKAACTSRWQRQEGMDASVNRPISADCWGEGAPAWLREKAGLYGSEGALVRSLSKKQRQEYYTFVGRKQRPLFDDNYDDTVCLDERHRQAMIAYVDDNPRRALLRRLLPHVMQRCLHIEIDGRSYGAFGNLFLLRWVRKIQVFCHRRHPVTGVPYETTDDYAEERRQWTAAILKGATVIVTPGISGGEKQMKNECLAKGYPLIHLQKDAIGPYWKPELQRFEACTRGSLLILAPWHLDDMDGVAGVPSSSDFSRFHNLNKLAAEICAFCGEAKIIGKSCTSCT